MTAVWKFELQVTDEQQIMLPRHSQIYKVAPSPGGDISMWVRVHVPDDRVDDWHQHPNRFEIRSLRVVGTGDPIEDYEKLRYIDSVIAGGGALVWHVFEVA
jgi:hypothetical protein